jgi:hypothetical protein
MIVAIKKKLDNDKRSTAFVCDALNAFAIFSSNVGTMLPLRVSLAKETVAASGNKIALLSRAVAGAEYLALAAKCFCETAKALMLFLPLRQNLIVYLEAVVRWIHMYDHALTILGIAPPGLYINPPVLHHFILFR